MSSDPQQEEQPFISHLIELRTRLVRSVIAVLLVFIALTPIAQDLYTYFSGPLRAQLPIGGSLIATEVASPFIIPFKLALVVAIFITIPYLLHQAWAFISPGLYVHERKLALPLLISSVALFYLGAAVAYYIVLPTVFKFIIAFAPEGVEVMTDIGKYLDFVLTVFFAFGLAFEIPVATVLLNLTGITTPEGLASKRPYIIVGAFFVAAIVTPPDVFSQVFFAGVVLVLFEAGLFTSRYLMRHRAQQQVGGEAGQAEDEELESAFDRAIADETALNKKKSGE